MPERSENSPAMAARISGVDTRRVAASVDHSVSIHSISDALARAT